MFLKTSRMKTKFLILPHILVVVYFCCTNMVSIGLPFRLNSIPTRTVNHKFCLVHEIDPDFLLISSEPQIFWESSA